MTDKDALNAMGRLVWDGQSLADSLKDLAEHNAEARKRNWPTNKYYWKMHATRSFGRWKYTPPLDDEDEL